MNFSNEDLVAQQRVAYRRAAQQHYAVLQRQLAQQKAAQEQQKASQERAAQQQREAQERAAQQQRESQERAAQQQRQAQERAAQQQRQAQERAAQQHKVHPPLSDKAIHVYGAEWCGFTRRQNEEIKAALEGDPNADQKLVYFDCAAGAKAKGCEGLPGFPLTVVHKRGEEYTLEELTKVKQPGYRSGESVVKELHEGTTAEPEHLPQAPAPPKKAKKIANKGAKLAIHVYGAEWCGFTRRQNKEIEEALAGDPDAKEKHVYFDCAGGATAKGCEGLDAFPLTVIHEVGQEYTLEDLTFTTKPGYRPGVKVLEELNEQS